MIRSDYSAGWFPSADAHNAPPESLLRGDNLVWDDLGVVTLRPGSSYLYTLTDLDVHSLHTAYLAGTRTRMQGAGDTWYANGTVLGTPFDGTGDITMFSWLGHVFGARGKTRVKYDGTKVTPWGLKGPTIKPSVLAQGPFAAVIATFHSAEDPAWVAEEGTITATFPTGADGVANGALEITPPATGTGRATIIKTWTSNQDFQHIAGFLGDDRDIMDLMAWIQKPGEVKSISVMVGLDEGSDPFKDNYYLFQFRLAGARQSSEKIPNAGTMRTVVENKATHVPTGDGANSANPTSGQPKIETRINPPTRPFQRSAVDGSISARARAKVQDRGTFRRRERPDAAYNPGWTHFSCTRGQFSRIGTTSGLDWSTVRAIKIVYNGTSGARGVVRYDALRFLGGAGVLALAGKYYVKYRFANTNGYFTEKSTGSPASDGIELVGNAAIVVVPRAALEAKDPHADLTEIYLYGGTLPDYFRVHIAGVSPIPAQFGTKINEFPKDNDGLLNNIDRLRLCTGDFSFPNGLNYALAYEAGMRIGEWPKQPDGQLTSQDRLRMCTMDFASPVLNPHADGNLTIQIQADEATALIDAQVLERDFRLVPEYVVSVSGPHEDRLLVLSQQSGKRGTLAISERRQPSQFRFSRAFAVGDDTEECLWVETTTGGSYVGTTADIYALIGTGDEDPIDDTADLTFKRMNIGSPPVDKSITREGNLIIYRARDGWRSFNGSSSQPVPRGAVDLLYKGKTRHGVSGVNSAGRFRVALNNDIMTAIVPEGSSDQSSVAIHRYDQRLLKWYRHVYPYNLKSIHRERDGTLIAGDTAGHVIKLDDSSVSTDNGAAQPVELWTREDDSDVPYSRKEIIDLYMGLDLVGGNLTFDLRVDGASPVGPATLITPGTYPPESIQRSNSTNDAIGFTHQIRLSGTATTLRWRGYTLNNLIRPPLRTMVDTGYINIGKNDLVEIRAIRFMAHITAATVAVNFYSNGSQLTGKTVTALAGVRVYEVPLGRGMRSSAPRIVITSSGSFGATVGIECFWIEIDYEPLGNENQKTILRVPSELINR